MSDGRETIFEQSCDISRKLNKMLEVSHNVLASYSTYRSVFLFQNGNVVESEKTRQFERKLSEINDIITNASSIVNELQLVINDLDELNEPL